MTIKILTISELKTKLAGVVAHLDAGGVPVYVTQHGKPKAVVVRYEEYEALLEKLDDLEDALAMREATSSPEAEAVGLTEYEHRGAAPVRS